MASLYFRVKDPAALKALLTKLEAEFAQAPQIDEKARNQLGLLGSLLQKNMDTLADPAQREASRAQLRQLAGNMPLQSMASGEKALLVQQGNFVSLFWGDRIRSDNLDEQTRRYAALSGLPVLGIGTYQEANLTLYAVNGEQESEAYYWFEQDEIQPGDGAELCELLGLPQETAPALEHAFDAETLEELTHRLQKALGITLDPAQPAAISGTPTAEWPGASFYKQI